MESTHGAAFVKLMRHYKLYPQFSLPFPATPSCHWQGEGTLRSCCWGPAGLGLSPSTRLAPGCGHSPIGWIGRITTRAVPPFPWETSCNWDRSLYYLREGQLHFSSKTIFVSGMQKLILKRGLLALLGRGRIAMDHRRLNCTMRRESCRCQEMSGSPGYLTCDPARE